MKYPRLVYTSPGPAKCQNGTYGYELVEDKAAHDAAIKAGFFDTVPDALDNVKKPKKAT